MRTLALDGQMGTSGDVLVGALLTTGADTDAFASFEKAPNLTVEIEPVGEREVAATPRRGSRYGRCTSPQPFGRQVPVK